MLSVIYIKLHLPGTLNYFFPGFCSVGGLTGSPGRDSPLGPCGPGGPIAPGSPGSPRGPIEPYIITKQKTKDVSQPHSYKRTTVIRLFIAQIWKMNINSGNGPLGYVTQGPFKSS